MEEDQSPARPTILDRTTQFSKVKTEPAQSRIGISIKNFEQGYVYASLVVTRKQHINDLKAQLKKHRFDADLSTPFGHLSIIGANFVGIIYHNNPHSEIVECIRNSTDFIFQGRQTQIIPIRQMIKLVNRNGKRMLPKSDFDDLQKIASKEFDEDNIKIGLWRYINDNNETELYLKTGNDACTALMYLVLNHQGQRAQIKNPQDISQAKCIFSAAPSGSN